MIGSPVASASTVRGRQPAVVMLAIVLGVIAGAALVLFLAVPGRYATSAVRYSDVPLVGHPFALRLALPFALAAAGFMVAGATASLGARDPWLAALTFGFAGTWLAPELVAWGSGPPVVRAMAYLATPMMLPLSMLVPIRALAVRPGPLIRWSLAALTAVVAVMALVRALTYDPFVDIECVSQCGYGMLAVLRDVPTARSITKLLGIVALGVGIANVAWASTRLLRLGAGGRSRQGGVLAATIAVGAAMAVWASARIAVPSEVAADPRFLVPATLTAVACSFLGAAICERLGQVIRRRNAVRRIADRLDDEAPDGGGVTGALARTLDDPHVSIAFPALDGSGFVDEQGRAVAEPTPTAERAVTVVERGGSLIALVGHDPDIGSQLLTREIGATARLTVENARLTAMVRARLRELRESRKRIVETGDRARQALERDLHDGAQQRCLAVSFELRLARDDGARAGAPDAELGHYDSAIAEVDQALTELRDLAHGIHPVVLTDEGLRSALVSLADRALATVTVRGGQDVACPDEAVGLAAYQAVSEAVGRVERVGGRRVDVSIGREDGWLLLVVMAERIGDGSWLSVEDRVGAAGGTVETRSTGGRVTRLEVRLPCA